MKRQNRHRGDSEIIRQEGDRFVCQSNELRNKKKNFMIMSHSIKTIKKYSWRVQKNESNKN